MEAGFPSVMFDGSKYSIEENIEKTKELVAAAHAKGISIEAEVGSIGGEEDGVVGMGECADPAECKQIADLFDQAVYHTHNDIIAAHILASAFGYTEDDRRIALLCGSKNGFGPLKIVDIELTYCIMASYCFLKHFCC